MSDEPSRSSHIRSAADQTARELVSLRRNLKFGVALVARRGPCSGVRELPRTLDQTGTFLCPRLAPLAETDRWRLARCVVLWHGHRVKPPTGSRVSVSNAACWRSRYCEFGETGRNDRSPLTPAPEPNPKPTSAEHPRVLSDAPLRFGAATLGTSTGRSPAWPPSPHRASSTDPLRARLDRAGRPPMALPSIRQPTPGILPQRVRSGRRQQSRRGSPTIGRGERFGRC